MRTEQLRRLPVVESDGRLAGIVSLHDIAIQARGRQTGGISPTDVVEAFIQITAQPPMGSAAVA
jgi:CBS-domain-containing membrane protein